MEEYIIEIWKRNYLTLKRKYYQLKNNIRLVSKEEITVFINQCETFIQAVNDYQQSKFTIECKKLKVRDFIERKQSEIYFAYQESH